MLLRWESTVKLFCVDFYRLCFLCLTLKVEVHPKHAMPNQRSSDKTKVNMWMTEKEKAALVAQAEKHGFSSVTDFIKAVATGAVKVSPHIKALAIAAMGTQAGGAGCLWFFLAIPAALWMFL